MGHCQGGDDTDLKKQNNDRTLCGGAATVRRTLGQSHGSGESRTPDSRQRQLRDQGKSCGNQPAYIRMIYRRDTGPAPSKNPVRNKYNPPKYGGQVAVAYLTTGSHIRLLRFVLARNDNQ